MWYVVSWNKMKNRILALANKQNDDKFKESK